MNVTLAHNSIEKKVSVEKQDNDWTFLKEVSGIKVFYKINNCESQEDLLDPINISSNLIYNHQTFKLKFINENAISTSISFSKITTLDNTNETETINLSPGTTILDSCENTAKLILTQKADDKYPISVTDFLQAFTITTNN